jgi:hypothetical protein
LHIGIRNAIQECGGLGVDRRICHFAGEGRVGKGVTASQLWEQIVGALRVVAVLHGRVGVDGVFLNAGLVTHIQEGRPLGRIYFQWPAILDAASAARLVEPFHVCRWIEVNTSWSPQVCHSIQVLDR